MECDEPNGSKAPEECNVYSPDRELQSQAPGERNVYGRQAKTKQPFEHFAPPELAELNESRSYKHCVPTELPTSTETLDGQVLICLNSFLT